MEHCVEKYDLKKHVQFNTTITKAIFDDASGTWTIADDEENLLRESDNILRRWIKSGVSSPH